MRSPRPDIVFGTSRKAENGAIVDGIEMVRCDVVSDESVNAAMSHVRSAAGRVDLLVNNAGAGMLAAAEESSIEQVHSLFDTNVYGTVRMINAVLPIMRGQGSGRIINLSSILGLIPAPFSAFYAATKRLKAIRNRWTTKFAVSGSGSFSSSRAIPGRRSSRAWRRPISRCPFISQPA